MTLLTFYRPNSVFSNNILMNSWGVKKHHHVSHFMSQERSKSLLSIGFIIIIRSDGRNCEIATQHLLGKQDRLDLTQMSF